MEKVKVYNYEGHSITQGENINHGRWATMEYINSRPLVAIKESMMEVPLSSLDPEGRYIETEEKPGARGQV